jgi:uncharacterized protein
VPKTLICGACRRCYVDNKNGERAIILAPGIVLPEAEIAEVCRRYQVKELAVFGSAARGDARPGSDIDLLVDFLPQARISLLGHSAMERELSALLGRKVDLVRNVL